MLYKPLETDCMKYKILFSEENKKNISNFAQRVVKFKETLFRYFGLL